MSRIKVPFQTAEERDTFLNLDVPDENLVHSFVPSEPPKLSDITSATAYAVEHPIDSKPLSKLLRAGARVVIVTENQFRAAPVHLILPPLLATIRAANAEASIVIGNAKRPPLSPQDIERKLGKEVAASGISVVCNDVTNPDNYVYVGTTTRGVPLFVLREVADADIKITISTTQASLWGYGGSGMIVPAVSGEETTEMNHMFALSDDCRPGNNDCHMQQDKYDAARMVGIDLAIHVIVSNRFDVIYLTAGDFVRAHKVAIRAYEKIYRFDATRFAGPPVDIVITGSSAPTGGPFLQCGWAIVNCDPICKDGGTIIQAGQCPGYGAWPGFHRVEFLQAFMPPTSQNKVRALKAFYTKDRELSAGSVWWKIYEVMTRKAVTIVTKEENLKLSRSYGLNTVSSLQAAFDEAFQRHGPNARVAFVPYGRYSVLDI